MKGALIVTLIVIPVTVIGIVVALLLAPDDDDDNDGAAAGNIDCVTGDEAQNPMRAGPDGRELTLPATETFDAVEEAERFICLDVPQVQEVGAWYVDSVRAHRSHSLSEDGQYQGARWLDITYANDDLESWFSLTVPGPQLSSPGDEIPVTVQGDDTILWMSDERPTFAVRWEAEGVPRVAGGHYADGADVRTDVLPVLETVH